MSDDQTMKLVRQLADIEAIKQLKHVYCDLCDDDYDANPLAELFTEDAVWDGGPIGAHVGREAIRDFFKGTPARVRFALHMVTNPIITVEGDCATGRWYLWEPLVYALPGGDEAWWMSARYDDRYRRTGTGWKFERVAITMKMLAPYEKGWGGARITDVYAELRQAHERREAGTSPLP